MAEIPSTTVAPPHPRRRIGGFQVCWIAALLLAVAGGVLLPFGRPPRIVREWPGAGPAAKPRGWDERRAEFPAMKERDRGAVVFVGDSITARWESLSADFPELKVANRGIDGDTSRALFFRFQADVLSLEPRAVVLLVGTNDLFLGARPSDVATNVRGMLEALESRCPKTPVVLCAVMPRAIEPGRFPEQIMELNAQLRAIALVRPGVAWCDTFSPFADETGGTRDEEFPDGLHLGEAGYAKWAQVLRESLKHVDILK